MAGIEMNLASGQGEIVVIQEEQLLLTKSTLTNPRLWNLHIHIVVRSMQASGLANSAQISGPTFTGCLLSQFRYSCFSASGC